MQLSNTTKARLRQTYGPWALITGASSGIGRELTIRLAEAGLNTVLVARREHLLRELGDDLHQRYSIDYKIIAVDVSHPEGIEDVILRTSKLDIGLLVAAAGFGTSGDFIHADLDDERDMLAVNCGALLALTHRFIQRFRTRKRSGIILLSSIVGFQGVPHAAHYAATKAYVQSLGEALYHELRPLGIDVLAAAPGPVDSGFASRANMQMNMTLKPTQVGIPILQALGKRSTVLPGFLTKFLVTSLRMVPRWGKVRIMAQVMRGMTKHQYP